MTQIYSIGLGGDGPKAGRPQSTGQWTNISVVGVDTGGTGESSSQVVVSAGAGGVARMTRSGRSGLSSASTVVASVGLPMPDNLQFNYGADWTVDGTGDMERAISSVGGIIDGTQDLSAVGGVAGGLENRLIAMGNSTGFRKSLKDRGIGFNPHKEMFYGGPQARSFPLQWNISFSSKREAEQFESMFQVLLEHMHPEFRDGRESGVWKIPESFKISFEGARVRKINDAVLVSASVDYAGSGAGWKAFHDGTPAHVTLSMSFTELSPLTREDIRNGM